MEEKIIIDYNDLLNLITRDPIVIDYIIKTSNKTHGRYTWMKVDSDPGFNLSERTLCISPETLVMLMRHDRAKIPKPGFVGKIEDEVEIWVSD